MCETERISRIEWQNLGFSWLDFHHNTMYIHGIMKPLALLYVAHQVRME